jgi:hypothetical protein
MVAGEEDQADAVAAHAVEARDLAWARARRLGCTSFAVMLCEIPG